MNLHPVQSAGVPVRQRTSLPSWAPAERLTVGEMLTERRKFDEETLRKERNSRSAKIIVLPKNRHKGPKSLFRRWKTTNSDAYLIFIVQTHSKPELRTFLLEVYDKPEFPSSVPPIANLSVLPRGTGPNTRLKNVFSASFTASCAPCVHCLSSRAYFLRGYMTAI